MDPSNKLPDLLTMAKNAATAATQEIKAVATGAPAVSEGEAARRWRYAFAATFSSRLNKDAPAADVS